MTFADWVDLRIDALNRDRMGAEYTPHASMSWRNTMARWFVFKALVDLLDRAVRDPVTKASAAILQTAEALTEQSVFELSSALTDAGAALIARPLLLLPAIEVIHTDEKE